MRMSKCCTEHMLQKSEHIQNITAQKFIKLQTESSFPSSSKMLHPDDS